MLTISTNQYTFECVSAANITNQLLQDCSDLFSNNYGVWSSAAGDKRAGNDNGWIAFARTKADNLLVSYAIAIRQTIIGLVTLRG
jgi:hypothetical protein